LNPERGTIKIVEKIDPKLNLNKPIKKINDKIKIFVKWTGNASNLFVKEYAVMESPNPNKILNVGPAKHALMAIAGYPDLDIAVSAAISPIENPNAITILFIFNYL
jgi:hypothetical protein